MKIVIKTHHVSITKALKEYAETKIQKLDRFFDNIQEIVIDLDVSRTASESEQQMASATVHASGTIIRAEETSASLYSSIDILIDKLESQLKKHKEKLREHKRDASIRKFQVGSIEKTVLTPKSDARYVAKPMDPEDAVAILEKEHLSFLAFRDMHERVCVIYPLGEGQFGLIET